MTILETTEEVCNEEATKHQAHGQKGGVGVRPFNLQLMDGKVAVIVVLDMLFDERVKGVVRRVVQVFVVQNQRVGFENLRLKIRQSKIRD